MSYSDSFLALSFELELVELDRARHVTTSLERQCRMHATDNE